MKNPLVQCREEIIKDINEHKCLPISCRHETSLDHFIITEPMLLDYLNRQLEAVEGIIDIRIKGYLENHKASGLDIYWNKMDALVELIQFISLSINKK